MLLKMALSDIVDDQTNLPNKYIENDCSHVIVNLECDDKNMVNDEEIQVENQTSSVLNAIILIFVLFLIFVIFI